MGAPPVVPGPVHDYGTRAITIYPEPPYLAPVETPHNGQKVVGRAVVLRRDPR